MATPPVALLGRGFLPTWFAVAGIVGVQMLGLVILPESPRTRGAVWTPDATALVLLVVVTATGAWAFPRVRAATWLIGAMCVALLAMQHTLVAPHELVPPADEVLGFYVVAAVLLAIGTWERSRAGRAAAPEVTSSEPP